MHRTSVANLIPHAVKVPVFNARMLLAAVRSLIAQPATALSAIGTLLHSRTPGIALKNLAVYPKAAWLAKLAVEWKADHIHGHWASVPSSIAMVASALSGIPFSFTAHRWDIAENNLLGEKTTRAQFVRFIADDGLGAAKALKHANVGELEAKGVVVHMGVTLPS